MRTVDIPGGTARFKTKEELRGRDSKLVRSAVFAAQHALEKLGDETGIKPGETKDEAAKRLSAFLKENKVTFTQEEAMTLLSMREAIVVAYLHEWTLELPKPTLETIGDLPEALYDALDDAIGVDLQEVTAGTDFSPNPDQSSPTGPSSASNGSLRAEPFQEPSSTSSSSSEDVPSNGESSSTPLKTITTAP